MIIHKKVNSWLDKFKPGVKFRYVHSYCSPRDPSYIIISPPILDTTFNVIEWNVNAYIDGTSPEESFTKTILRFNDTPFFNMDFNDTKIL